MPLMCRSHPPRPMTRQSQGSNGALEEEEEEEEEEKEEEEEEEEEEDDRCVGGSVGLTGCVGGWGSVVQGWPRAQGRLLCSLKST